MPARRIATKWLRKLLASQGYALTNLERASRVTMAGAIKTIAERNHSLGTIIDIGASDGRWSEIAITQLPSCRYLLIEAQKVHTKALTRFCREYPNAQFAIAAAGDISGNAYFKANRPLGGQASHKPFRSHNIKVPMTTIDKEVETRQLKGPFLLKFDTHGFEGPILKGARETLENTETIVMECYNFRISPECQLFHEMCDTLSQLGFRCIDLVDPLYRPHDNSFWQMDLVFARDTRREFTHSTFN